MVLALGCTREIDTNVTRIEGEFTLYATSGEKDTRTVIQQDGRIFWSPSDCITVFYGNIPGRFTSTNTEPAASAEFTGSLGSFVLDGETEFKAIYPYSDDIVIPSDDGILSIYLPSEQSAVEGTFADDLFICVAKSKDVNLHFYNVCGGVKFSLARGDIKRVVFKGNNGEILTGRMAVEFDSDGKPNVANITSGRSSVTLEAPEGGAFKEGIGYYLVLAPQMLTKGYTMELYADELVETIVSDSSVTIRRSAWGVLKNLGNPDSSPTIPEAVDLGIPSGLKWASFNLGATKPEECGKYYAWGEIASKEDYSWATYKWMQEGQFLERYIIKYTCADGQTFGIWYDSDGNFIGDGKTSFADSDFADDPARALFGDSWRSPTDAEWTWLLENCSWTWTDDYNGSGVAGRIVTSNISGYEGNSIFLPAVGFRAGTSLNYPGVIGCYWSSSLYEGSSTAAWGVLFDSGSGYREPFGRHQGLSIRPVFGDLPVPVESITLSETDIEIEVGKTYQLTATVLPENATIKDIIWSSSNESVATVSTTGIVTGVSAGSAIITVTTVDGEMTASCEVGVKHPGVVVDDQGDVIIFTINGVELRMIRVEGGTFRMGSHHDVTLSTYYISDRPVSKRLFSAIVNGKDSGESGYYTSGWAGKSSDILKLNELTGRNFHLTSEAQFEFAAKGGIYSHGYSYAGTNDSSLLTWDFPNELNIYMMSSYQEWVYDYCCAYPNTAVVDPVESVWKRNWPSGDWHNETLMRVVRGSGNVENRQYLQPYHQNNKFGHRLVLDTTNDSAWNNGDYVGDYK